MKFREEVWEACKRHDAYNATQMLNMLQDLPWVKIDERYYLDSKSANPIGLASGLKETVIDGKWYYSVDTVMEQMRNNPNRYGSLFRSKVIAEIGGGIRFHYPKNAHELTILLSKLDKQAYIMYDNKRLHVVPLRKDKDGKLKTNT